MFLDLDNLLEIGKISLTEAPALRISPKEPETVHCARSILEEQGFVILQ